MSVRPATARVVVATVLLTFLTVTVLLLAAVFTGVIAANADAQPSMLETLAAKISLGATILRETHGLHDPLAVREATLVEGTRLYGKNCAVCHGAADGQPSLIARGLYQKPPQFAKDDVTSDPVERTYWKVTHGIRLTGMPAYKDSLTENERWAIAMFLKHQHELPPKAQAAWRALPSTATANNRSKSAGD